MTRSALIKTITHQAGEAIKNMSPTKGFVDKGGRGNFATAADLMSEKLIIDAIKKHFPQDSILSEETATHVPHPHHLKHLWVIDPIDGTNNFYYRRNYSAVSIAYIEEGEVIYGAVYNPFVNEFFFAQRGKGAYLNEARLAVDRTERLGETSVSTDNGSHSYQTAYNFELAALITPAPWFLLRGSAALSLCDVAAGRTGVYFHTWLKPWDLAAGLLVIHESGGVVVDHDGNNALFTDPAIIAGNQKLVAKLIEFFKNRPPTRRTSPPIQPQH